MVERKCGWYLYNIWWHLYHQNNTSHISLIAPVFLAIPIIKAWLVYLDFGFFVFSVKVHFLSFHRKAPADQHWQYVGSWKQLVRFFIQIIAHGTGATKLKSVVTTPLLKAIHRLSSSVTRWFCRFNITFFRFWPAPAQPEVSSLMLQARSCP